MNLRRAVGTVDRRARPRNGSSENADSLLCQQRLRRGIHTYNTVRTYVSTRLRLGILHVDETISQVRHLGRAECWWLARPSWPRRVLSQAPPLFIPPPPPLFGQYGREGFTSSAFMPGVYLKHEQLPSSSTPATATVIPDANNLHLSFPPSEEEGATLCTCKDPGSSRMGIERWCGVVWCWIGNTDRCAGKPDDGTFEALLEDLHGAWKKGCGFIHA